MSENEKTIMDKEEAKQIANTIFKQIGGNKFATMTGATNFASHENGALSFRFKMCRKMNYLKISLNGLDLYDMEFKKIGTARTDYKITDVSSHSGIFAEDLAGIFERETGLYTRL